MISHIKTNLRESTIRVLKRLRSFQRRISRSTKPQINKDRIVHDLTNLGIKKGDIIYVASSLSRIGNVVNGASDVIDALLEAIGRDGTLTMPCYYFKDGEMVKVFESGEIFDPDKTPTVMGAIPETFRRRVGTCRSIHPTHSICASGPLSKWITQGHESSPTTFGKGSPFAKLVDLNAKIVLLGVDIRVITFYHYFEDVTENFPVNPYYKKMFTAKVLVEGNVKTFKIKAHDPKVAITRIDHPEGAYIRNYMTSYLLSKSLLKPGFVGCAKSYIIHLRDLMRALGDMLEQNITIYSTSKDINIQRT